MLIRKQFLFFIGIGLLCAVIDISIAKLMVYAGVYYGTAVSVGFLSGLVANYALHAKVTFKAVSSGPTILKFAVVVAVNYLITMVFSSFSVQLTGDFLAGKVLSLPIVAVNGFLLSRYWVFR
jgi:putative flippase GtrA